ncbi:RNA recognition motif domain-containing protein [Aliiglaciecola sp. M165]|uniref:RNA recognition motif domain-containing protein n=1 Tax=Aliiglaciecola sp. M165 TaxID=2593649 RepID=UPI00117BEA6F|nr:RNA-binding protein [Aliiglaciecola sp. M165]TRY29929.1 RNA-binding protein [Aliiglaciecola sp. M165]
MNILVRKLARTTTEDSLRDIFLKFGEVESCDLVLDSVTGKSKGFGFVVMPNEAEAMAAINKLNLSMLDNHAIRVKIADS